MVQLHQCLILLGLCESLQVLDELVEELTDVSSPTFNSHSTAESDFAKAFLRRTANLSECLNLSECAATRFLNVLLHANSPQSRRRQ